MFRQLKNIMLKGIMLFSLFCIARVMRILKMQWR